MRQKQVGLPVELYQRLKHLADVNNRTMVAEIRRAVTAAEIRRTATELEDG